MCLIANSLSQMFLVQETTGENLFRKRFLAANYMAFEKGNDNSSFLVRSTAPGELQHITSKLWSHCCLEEGFEKPFTEG